MGRQEARELCIVDKEDRISIWLQDAEFQEYEEGVSELGDSATADPITPLRRPSLLICCEEMSPTNTSFSEDSIFDTLGSLGNGLIEDVFYDDIPDEAPGEVVDKRNERAVYECRDADCFKVESHASYKPPSEVTKNVEGDQGKTLRHTVETIIDPDKPRPTWLTSCAQCIHANLPCSRKAPACSRCRRKGQAAMCLLHRRPYPEEILKSNARWSTTLKLLKLKDENEEDWGKKLGLAEELRDSWRTANDYKNWILPPVESPKESFHGKIASAEQHYPGEGLSESKNRFSYQELCVAIGD